MGSQQIVAKWVQPRFQPVKRQSIKQFARHDQRYRIGCKCTRVERVGQVDQGNLAGTDRRPLSIDIAVEAATDIQMQQEVIRRGGCALLISNEVLRIERDFCDDEIADDDSGGRSRGRLLAGATWAWLEQR